MVDFSNFTIKVKVDNRRAIDNGRMKIRFKDEEIHIIVGTKSREWGGEQYTMRDIPLIEGHELEHVLMLLDGSDKTCMNPVFAIGFREKLNIGKHILGVEKEAWRRLFNGLNYIPIQWLIKAQTCMNAHLDDVHGLLRTHSMDDSIRWLFR